MATATDLMGLGMSPFLAGRMSNTPISITSQGASMASANAIGPFSQLVYVIGSNSGSGLKLPNVGGQNGCLLGDDFTVLNLLGGTIQVYASNASTIYIYGTSATGTTGVGLDPGAVGAFYNVTPTTWMAIKSSA